jgi:hypothetical protein
MGEYKSMLVCADDVHAYEALVDESDRWNGWLSPRFTLEVVKKMAADMQVYLKRHGYSDQEQLVVVEAPGYTGLYEGMDEDEHDDVPAAVVMKISWLYAFDEPKTCTQIITPDKDGLYSVGAWEWCWHEVSRNVSERNFWDFHDAVLNEAVWYEVQPDPSDEDKTPGMEWEDVEELKLGINNVPRDQRDAFTEVLHTFVSTNAEALNDIGSEEAGTAFWQSMRGSEGLESRSFLGMEELPEDVRRTLHESAQVHKYSTVTFEPDPHKIRDRLVRFA